VIYKKGGTKLLKEAETAGCKVLSGLSLLLYQGAASFTLWFETDPPINIMRDVIFRGDDEDVSS
jgi:shikimate 5-dehydrogenase